MQNDTSEYKTEELILNAEQVFGVKRECAAAALRLSKVNNVTKDEAEAIVKKFMNEEVI